MIRYGLPIAQILLTGYPASEEQAADIFTQGQLYHDDGDLDEATAAYNVAIELDLHAPEAYLHRGLAADTTALRLAGCTLR